MKKIKTDYETIIVARGDIKYIDNIISHYNKVWHIVTFMI